MRGAVDPAVAGWGSPMAPQDPTVSMSAPDLLGSPVPPDGPPRDWRTVVSAVIGAAAVGIAGTGIGLAIGLSGGGAQPEDVLPADVFAVVKVDFDPSGDQKLAARELAERFPDAGVSDMEDLKHEVLRRLLDGTDVDYDEQVAPWIGSRAAVAAAPDADGDGQPEVLVVAAYDDRAATEKALPDLLEKSPSPVHFAFSERGPYVLLAETQLLADAAADPDRVLADNETFDGDAAALDGDQVATAWADLGAMWDSLGEELRDAATTAYGDAFAPHGRFVAGLHLEPDALELTGRGFDLDLGDDALTKYALGTDAGQGLVEDLPAGAAAAGSVAGLGEQVGTLFDLVESAGFGGPAFPNDGVAELELQFGLRIPEDLTLLLGDETAVGVYDLDGTPGVAVRTRTADPAGALTVAQKLLRTAGQLTGAPSLELGYDVCAEQYGDLRADGVLPDTVPLEQFCGGAAPAPGSPSLGEVEQVEGGIAYGSTRDALDLVKGSGGLGDSEVFRRAVPESDGAAAILFADLRTLLPLFGMEPAELEKMKALEAVGMTSTPGPDGVFRLRVVLR